MNVVSFYTDERYKEIYLRLLGSCCKYNHKLFSPGEAVDKATWQEAIQYKPRLISQTYQTFGGPLLYLDADCEIVGDISYLDTIAQTYDVAVRARNLKDKYNCGVMLLGTNKEKILPFLKTWRKLTDRDALKTSTVDQKPFENALRLHSGIKVFNLSHEYNFLPADKLTWDIKSAKILHHKESKTNPKARAWYDIWRRNYRRKAK